MKWEPIKTAPLDRVIFTDCGVVRYVSQSGWRSPVVDGWYMCDLSGAIPICADEGMSISCESPAQWTELPDIPSMKETLELYNATPEPVVSVRDCTSRGTVAKRFSSLCLGSVLIP